MLISPAYAQAAGGVGGFDLVSLAPLVLIFVVFYFLLIRPQQKKAKQHRGMISALKRNDRVVTSGGIIGVVTKVISDTEIQLEIAENVRVRVNRSAISELVTRGPAEEPAKGDDAKSS